MLEADFTRFYSLDLRMLCWGPSPWGVRRLWTHIAGLPRDSAYSRRLRGEQAYWDEQVELTAQLVDAVNTNSYILRRAHFEGTPEKPEPIQRPGVAESELPVAPLSELDAWLKRGE